MDPNSRNLALAFPWVAHAAARTGCQRFKEETATSHDSLAPGVDCGGDGGVGQMYLPPLRIAQSQMIFMMLECATSVGRSVGISERVQGDLMDGGHGAVGWGEAGATTEVPELPAGRG